MANSIREFCKDHKKEIMATGFCIVGAGMIAGFGIAYETGFKAGLKKATTIRETEYLLNFIDQIWKMAIENVEVNGVETAKKISFSAL